MKWEMVVCVDVQLIETAWPFVSHFKVICCSLLGVKDLSGKVEETLVGF